MLNVAATYICVVTNDCLQHIVQGESICLQFCRIELRLILLLKTTHAYYFGDARDSQQLPAYIPILNSPQRSRIITTSGHGFDFVVVDLSQAGGDWPQLRGADRGGDLFTRLR